MTNATVQSFTLGTPQVAGALAVFPVFGPAPRFQYLPLSAGARVGELEGGASVTDLLVTNTAAESLLVYEGQEVLGAQQNRTFDCSILIGPGTKVRAPVTCVERGRWDDNRATEAFVESPQTADPSLRHTKRYAANAASAAGQEARADQGEVWAQVDARIARFAAPSPSDSMHEVYETRRGRLKAVSQAVQHVPGQLGAVATVSGLPVVCDLVSRPDVFATLLPRLAQGYALDALDRPEGPVDGDRARRLLATILEADQRTLATPGLGWAFALHGGVTGSGLYHGGELIQLCAFPGPPA